MSGLSPEQASRRAALAVHAMSTEDRDWLLRELALPQRTRLQALLSELRDIGIPRDAAVLQEAAAAPPRASADAEIVSTEAARSLANWVRAQPPQAGARLIAARPAWRAGLLRVLSPVDRALLESARRDLRPAPGLDRLVLDAARRHLASDLPASRWKWARTLASRISRRRGQAS